MSCDTDAPSESAQLANESPTDERAPTVPPGESSSPSTVDTEPPGATATSDPLATLAAAVELLTADSQKYHQRAAHRESMIDRLHFEVEKLRGGERRSLLRPLLTEVARVRNDLLRQAETLPADFDASKAALLLRSFADSLDFALEDNGVSTYTPGIGDSFEPRVHRGVGRIPADIPEQVNTVASVRTPGYRDLETGQVISSAQVLLYVKQDITADSTLTAAAESPTAERTDLLATDSATENGADDEIGSGNE
jgi:molecular chaperone GrpE